MLSYRCVYVFGSTWLALAMRSVLNTIEEEFRGSQCGCPSAHLSLQCDLSYRFKHKTFFLISLLRGCGIVDPLITLATWSTSGPCHLPHISEKTNVLFLTRVLTKDIQGDLKLNIQGTSKLNGMYLVWLYFIWLIFYLYIFYLIDFKINSIG